MEHSYYKASQTNTFTIFDNSVLVVERPGETAMNQTDLIKSVTDSYYINLLTKSLSNNHVVPEES